MLRKEVYEISLSRVREYGTVRRTIWYGTVWKV